MCDDYVGRILGALPGLDPYRAHMRIETDDISTLLVGPPGMLFPAIRDLFLPVARSGVHVTLSILASRGCPGEPDDPICIGGAGTGDATVPLLLLDEALSTVRAAEMTGQSVAAQFALLPMGTPVHMAGIGSCIDFLRETGLFDRSKHFCSKLRGDLGPVCAALQGSFLAFAPASAHVVLSATLSANSPTRPS
jgi:hypothetical protein